MIANAYNAPARFVRNINTMKKSELLSLCTVLGIGPNEVGNFTRTEIEQAIYDFLYKPAIALGQVTLP